MGSLEASESADGTALASGYAQAFQCSGKSTVAIIYQGALQTETIKDVSEIKNFGAVLLVKSYGGSRQILDAARVVKIRTTIEISTRPLPDAPVSRLEKDLSSWVPPTHDATMRMRTPCVIPKTP